MTSPELPSFDLVVATVDRTDELDHLLASLDRQTHRGFRVLLVDQNDDDRLAPILAAHDLDRLHLRSPRGLSRARNAALPHLTADLVAFPDDDCVYGHALLERVGGAMLERPRLDGLTGRAVASDGSSEPSWERDPALLTDSNLWNRAISFTIFLRREVVGQVGDFDESLGLGSGTPWSSGEEIDYLVRALRGGAGIAYEPELTVVHEPPRLSGHELTERGRRDGASLGYLLRKHRYPASETARRLVRPAGGALLSLARFDVSGARYHAATLRGRVAGLTSR